MIEWVVPIFIELTCHQTGTATEPIGMSTSLQLIDSDSSFPNQVLLRSLQTTGDETVQLGSQGDTKQIDTASIINCLAEHMLKKRQLCEQPSL